jgi:hypothetical protein
VIPFVMSVKAAACKNKGKVMHEMVVVKTTKESGSLVGTGNESEVQRGRGR